MNDEFDYIDIASIDRERKNISAPTRSRAHEAPSRARQIIKAKDVLVSTVRPNLNAVAWVPDSLDGAIASTGFTVLRCNGAGLYDRFLYHWVRTRAFVDDMVRQATGASYPAVTDRIVRESEVPLPPLAEQKRIAAILDKADAICRRRQSALELIEGLLHSTFLDTVGPGATGYENWPRRTVESLARSEKGSMRTGPFGSTLRHSEFVDEGIAVLGIDNAVKNRFAWGERRFITPEKYKDFGRYTVWPSDVIITIMATIGRSAVVPDDIPTAITTKHLAAITLDRGLAEPEFMSNAIHRHPAILQQLGATQRGAIMSGLNLGIIKSLELPLPPIEVQRRFTRQVQSIRKRQQEMQGAIEVMEHLFNSLVQRAFRGEL